MRVPVVVALTVTIGLAGACGGGDPGPGDELAPASTATTVGPSAAAMTAVSPWPVDPATIDPAERPTWGVEVLERIPHDPTAFTQGLEILDDDVVLESTGLRGHSSIRLVDRREGTIRVRQALDAAHFGEGLTRVGDTVIQLTWQAGIAYRWQLPDLTPLDPFAYDGEGWGLCAAEGRLAMSDGSALLTWRDPSTFETVETVTVLDRDEPVERLNELECIDGHVIANVWMTDRLVVIRPDGAVVATIDGAPLVAEIAAVDGGDVLNGIADLSDGTLLIGGKRWPTFFRVRLTAS